MEDLNCVFDHRPILDQDPSWNYLDIWTYSITDGKNCFILEVLESESILETSIS